MRITLTLTVLLVAAVCSSDAWGRFRVRFRGVRRVWRKVKPIAIQAARCYVITHGIGAAVALGKRSANEFDTNTDGVIDQPELESFLNTRDAVRFLQLTGNDKIDVEEFQQAMDEARRHY